MKIALIGASGFVGQNLLHEALQRGHQVTAIVRNPEKIQETNPNLTVVKADVMDAASIAPLLKGSDAVISAYNAGWQNPNLHDDFLKGSANINEAVKESGVKRLLVVGGAGSLEIAPGVQLVDTPQFPAEWKSGALAAREALNKLKNESELEWTFLSPAIMLEPGQRTGQFRLGKDNPIFDEKGDSKISVQDLAVALIDETEKPQHIRERFTLGY